MNSGHYVKHPGLPINKKLWLKLVFGNVRVTWLTVSGMLYVKKCGTPLCARVASLFGRGWLGFHGRARCGQFARVMRVHVTH